MKNFTRNILPVFGILSLSVNADTTGEFFSQPQKLCSALASEGLSTGGWKASTGEENTWLCMTQLLPFGAVSANGSKNNIAFYVNGENSARAYDIRIKININNPKDKKSAFTHLSKMTNTLFKTVGEPVPEELDMALSKQQPTSLNVSYGRVELILEPGRIESYKVVLTDAKYSAGKEKSRIQSTGDFEACRAVVAKAAGYSESFLSGDGEPIQESGYISFMLKGKGNDLFFCEVSLNRHYKIKAALNGKKFPLKYIAEGIID